MKQQLRALLVVSLAASLTLGCGTDGPTSDEAVDTTDVTDDVEADIEADEEEPVEEDAHGAGAGAGAGADAGADDGADDTDRSDEGGEDDGGTTGELGTVTVGASSYRVERVIVCDPDEDAGFDRDLELQAIGDADGSRVQLDVVLGGILPVDVSWAGPEGIFGMGEAGTADANQDGDRLTGTASLEDPFGEGETVDLSFDVVVPERPTSCR